MPEDARTEIAKSLATITLVGAVLRILTAPPRPKAASSEVKFTESVKHVAVEPEPEPAGRRELRVFFDVERRMVRPLSGESFGVMAAWDFTSYSAALDWIRVHGDPAVAYSIEKRFQPS